MDTVSDLTCSRYQPGLGLGVNQLRLGKIRVVLLLFLVLRSLVILFVLVILGCRRRIGLVRVRAFEGQRERRRWRRGDRRREKEERERRTNYTSTKTLNTKRWTNFVLIFVLSG